jgi:hypothetical protein
MASNEDIRNPTSNDRSNPAVNKLRGDPEFMKAYMSDNNYVRSQAIERMNNAYSGGSQRTYNTPSEASSKDVQKQINSLMKDKAFMERYQSDNPKTRANAVNQLNSLFEQAYGNAPNEDQLTGKKAIANGEEGTKPNSRQAYIPENPYISSASEERNTMRQAPQSPPSHGNFATEVFNRWRAANGVSGPSSGSDTGTAITKDRSKGWDAR